MTITVAPGGKIVDIPIPKGWIELRSDRVLRSYDKVYNWNEHEFWDMGTWNMFGQTRSEVTGITRLSIRPGAIVGTMLAIRKISGFFGKPKKLKKKVKPKNIKRLNNQEFLNKMKDLIE